MAALSGTRKALEVKLGETIQSGLFAGLQALRNLADLPCDLRLVYGGEESYECEGVRVQGWRDAADGF